MFVNASVTVKKAEHLYSALHSIQTILKRPGMDHTAVLVLSNWSWGVELFVCQRQDWQKKSTILAVQVQAKWGFFCVEFTSVMPKRLSHHRL